MPCRETVEHGKRGAAVGTFVCPVCSTSFTRYLCEVRRHPPTCSSACKMRLRPTKPRLRANVCCEVCKREFEVKRFRSSGKRRARFCSDACKNTGQKGVGHPQWKGGIAEARRDSRKVIAKRILEEGRCEECGSAEFLHGHHIKPFAEYPELRNEPSNIQVLCAKCHSAKHPHQARHLYRGVPRSGVTKDCPVCGTPFYVKRSHAAARKTCSKECGHRHKAMLRAI